jgi:hypothetical protein
MLLEVFVECVLNVVNLTLNPTHTCGYLRQNSHHLRMIFGVFFPEHLNECHHNATDRRDHGCNDDGPVGVHVRKAARIHGKRWVRRSEWLTSWLSIPSPVAGHRHRQHTEYAKAQNPTRD